MVVINLLKVVFTNMEAGSVMDLDAKKWPDAQTDDSSSFYKVPFSSIVYIERTDFRIKDSKDYYGLAPGKTVLLRYAFPIKCTEVVLGDDKESVLEIRVEYDSLKKTKPKGVLHWVAEPSPGVDPLKVEVRLFDRLFLSEGLVVLDFGGKEIESQLLPLTNVSLNNRNYHVKAYLGISPPATRLDIGLHFQHLCQLLVSVLTSSQVRKDQQLLQRQRYTRLKEVSIVI